MLKAMRLPLVLLFVFFCTTATHAAENIVINGDFETNASRWKHGTVATAWAIDNGESLRPGEFSLDMQVKHSGRASARFTDATHGLKQRVAVTAGAIYNLRFWTRLDLQSGGFGIHILWMDANGKWVFDGSNRQVTHGVNRYGILDWHEVTLDNVRAPDGAAFAVISTISIIEIDHSSVEGRYWIDDIVLETAASDRTGRPYSATLLIGEVSEAPVIDGKADEPMWEGASEIDTFVDAAGAVITPSPMNALMAYDRNALYVAVGLKKWSGDDEEIRITLMPAAEDGAVFQLRLRQDGTVSLWRNSQQMPTLTNLTAAIHRADDGWIMELSIPFESARLPRPRADSVWGLNITRHQAGEESVDASWSPIDSNQPAGQTGFGKVIFGTGSIRVRDTGFSRNEVSAEVANPGQAAVKTIVRLNRRYGDTYWQIGSADIELSPGEHRQIALAVPEEQSDAICWLTVEAEGKIILRQGCIPPAEYAAIDWNDPLKVLGQKLYVANDIRTFKPIQTHHNLPGGIAGPQLIERAQRPVDLFVELPSDIRVTHVVQFINNWRTWNPVEPAEVRHIVNGGQDISQYRFELPAIFNNAENGTMILFETDLPAGTKAAGKCYLQWDTGRQPSHPLDIEVITVGRMPPFKRLFNGIYYAEAELLLTWLPNLARDYPALGLNRLEIDPVPESGGSQGGANMGPSRREWFDRLVAQARVGQLYMATAPSQSTPWAQNWMSVDPSARAIDIHGNELLDSGNPSLCPLYRGPKFQEHLDRFLKGPTFNEYKMSWLALDLELWSDEAWERGCFCPRCLAAYAEFMKVHHPQENAGDPRGFMAEPAAYPAQAAQWKEFRDWSKQDFIQAFRKPIAALVAQNGGASGPRPGLLISEWIFPSPHLFDVVDYFEINCYRKPIEVARRLGKYGVNISKDRKNIVAAQGLGQTHGQDSMLTPRDMLYSIYEGAAVGMQGMVWYDITSLDALKLKTLVDGCRAIQPFEDIIVDGSCTVSVPAKPLPASARSVTLNGEMLLVVRNYGGFEKIKAQVQLPAGRSGPANVYDVQTRELLGAIDAGQTDIAVALSPDEARLLYIGTAAQWSQRIDANIN